MTISKDLKWNTHVSNVCTKANRNLGFLRRNLSACPKDVKEMAYKGLVRPVLEYASPVWDSHGIVVQEELEYVQNRAARFVTGNYNFETGSMTSILEQLGWESLHKRRKGSKLILLFKGLKGRASIHCDDLQPPSRRSRNQHPMAFQVPYDRTDIYKYSSFPDTVRDWNALPTSIISSAENSEDLVARFTSLVRDLETSLCSCWPWWMNVYWCITSEMFWFWSMTLPNITKIFQSIRKLWCTQEFGLEFHSRKITRKRIEEDLFYLHVTLQLDLVYVPTKYYQMLSSSMGVIPCIRFQLRGR